MHDDLFHHRRDMRKIKRLSFPASKKYFLLEKKAKECVVVPTSFHNYAIP